MNDRNRGGMTISALLMGGLIASVVVPVICLVVLGFMGPKTTTPFLPVLFLSIVVMVAGFTSNILIRRRIQDRLLGLVDVCRNFVGGDRSIRAVVNGDDEFAMLATSLNNLLDSQNFASSAGSPISSVGGSDAAALQAQIEKLLQEVSAVGDGDLRVQAEVTPDTLGVLADSFNYMIEELAKVVGRVQNTAVQVTNASRRVLDRSAELAQASETQVARISQTTKAVEALASFVQDVAHNARLSAEAAQDALRNAKTGQDSVRQSIEGMMLIRENVQETAKKIKRLGERSNEIGEIVRIIEDIADQTNLLALNAAIQSAMAGEHGRGFAVVADEIRLLAERSTESTKRIATLVKSIQGDTFEAVVATEDSTQEVVKGSQLADDAGRALNSIYAAVERQAQMIESIARAAVEQANVSESVAVAMGQISEITRQTNAGTQEAAMSVSYLSELVDQLRGSVSTFRLPERNNEMVEVFPAMSSGVPALAAASSSGEHYFQQDMDVNRDWNQGFSSDFLPVPQAQETGHSGPFQFAFSNQQEFSNPPGFPTPPQSNGQQAQPSNGQQFGSYQAGMLGQRGPQFGSQPQGLSSLPFASYPAFDRVGSFESQPGFDGQQQFGPVPDSGSGVRNDSNQSQPLFPPAGQNPGMQQQQGQSIVTPRPRWRTTQQGQASFGQDQVPFPNNGFGQ